MSEANIKAEIRSEFGKGAARRIRRENKIPAVIYGHGNDPTHITLPGHQTMLAIKHLGANALLELEIEGSKQLALTKAVQIDAIRRNIEHVDFVSVRKGEKVTVNVPVVIVGEAAAETMVHLENATVELEAEATHIPEQLEVSVDGAEAGTQYTAGELYLPQGSTLLSDPELLVVNVTQQASEEEVEAELEELEAEAGIEKDESEAEAEGEGDAAEAPSEEGGSEE